MSLFQNRLNVRLTRKLFHVCHVISFTIFEALCYKELQSHANNNVSFAAVYIFQPII